MEIQSFSTCYWCTFGIPETFQNTSINDIIGLYGFCFFFDYEFPCSYNETKVRELTGRLIECCELICNRHFGNFARYLLNKQIQQSEANVFSSPCKHSLTHCICDKEGQRTRCKKYLANIYSVFMYSYIH